MSVIIKKYRKKSGREAIVVNEPRGHLQDRKINERRLRGVRMFFDPLGRKNKSRAGERPRVM